MQLMKELWDEIGHSEIGLTSQNLRDHAEWLEKTVGNVREIIIQDVGNRDREIGRENDEMLINHSQTSSSSSATDLHSTPRTQVPEGHITSPINTSTSELIQSVPDPPVNPSGYLWMINCILYSVVVAFYISKGWKKREEERSRAGRSKFKLKGKEEYEAKACKIQGNISIAKAELERIKLNKEITKKGRRNQGLLAKECGTLSVASLISYMEKEKSKKSKLRKLKRSYSV